MEEKQISETSINEVITDKSNNQKLFNSDLYISEYKIINDFISDIDKQISVFSDNFINNCIFEIFELEKKTCEIFLNSINKFCEDTNNQIIFLQYSKNKDFISKFYNVHLISSLNEFDNFFCANIEIILQKLNSELRIYTESIKNLTSKLPQNIDLQLNEIDFKIKQKDTIIKKIGKVDKHLKNNVLNKPFDSKIEITPFINHFLINNFNEFLIAFLAKFDSKYTDIFLKKNSLVKYINSIIVKFIYDKNETEINFESLKSEVELQSKNILELFDYEFKNLKSDFLKSVANNISGLAKSLDSGIKPLTKNDINENSNSKVLLFPENWKKTIKLYLNTFETELKIVEVKFRFFEKIKELSGKVKTDFSEKNLTSINNILSKLNDISINPDKHEKLNISSDFEKYNNLSLVLNDLYETLKKSIEKLPANIEIINKTNNAILKSENFKSIDLKNITAKIIENRFFDNLQKSLKSITLDNEKQINDLNETIENANFNFENIDNHIKGRDAVKKYKLDIILQITQYIQNEKISLESHFFYIEDLFIGNLNSTFDYLSIENILTYSNEITSVKNTKTQKKFIKNIINFFKKIRNFILIFITNLIYKKSETKLLIESYDENYLKNESITENLLDLRDCIIPNQKNIENIPTFYYNLFSENSTFSDQFWIGRNAELTKAEKAIIRFRNGSEGGLIITGEPCSGKTELSKYIVNKFFSKDYTHFIKQKNGGSTNYTDFLDSIQEVVKINKDFDAISKLVKPHSVFIINDLELWWKRSENGFEVIDQILNLINKYSKIHFFIINCDIQFLNYISKFRDFNKSFLSIINCSPFSANELKNIVLTRHISTGYKFKYKNKKEEFISDLQIAKLFNSFFDYSHGNVGFALTLWLRSIKSIENDEINIQLPEYKNLEILETIEPDLLIYLIEFILHKQLSINKMKEISGIETNQIETNFRFLENSNIIVRNSNNIFSLNYYYKPFIYNLLKNKKII